MTPRSQLLSLMYGKDVDSPVFVPNLSLWYDWHAARGTLPAEWQGSTLAQVTRALGVPIWLTPRCYRIERNGAQRQARKRNGERVIRHVAPTGALVERWNLGPDGDWWQTEYPVKTVDDLAVLNDIISRRSYVLSATQAKVLAADVGDEGVVALELPRRPFAQLCLEWLGWTDGLMLLMDAADLVDEVLDTLEAKIQGLVAEVARLPFDVVYSPDNLDAQFISPGVFDQYLAGSYRASVEILHAHGKRFLAGTGGPIRRLLAPLAATGVDGIDGISGPPQSDATLVEARALTRPDFLLWGGIPQDALLPACSQADFEASVRRAAGEARDAGAVLVGIADRVPIDADLDRLRAIPALLTTDR